MIYPFELATPSDDASIRKLLRENLVPGRLDLTYEREPDYFLSTSIRGPICQTLVARRQESGEVVGMATRSVRPRFVNGEEENVGSMGQLRVDTIHRRGELMGPAFRRLRELHEDGAAIGYITIVVGNSEVEPFPATKDHPDYPIYRQRDRLFSLALVVRRPQRLYAATFEVLNGDEVGLDEIVAFLQDEGRRKQFFPVYTEGDFTGAATRDFNIADFAVACQGNRILGVLGLWDQSRYKQTVVRAYGETLRRIRAVYNAGARVLGAQPLTRIGQPIHLAHASFACVAEDDPAVFRALITQIHNTAAERGFAFLMLGLAARDPLLATARKWIHIPYASTLYTACWPGDERWLEKLDGRVPYVEVATL
jgi:hypothetical protein